MKKLLIPVCALLLFSCGQNTQTQNREDTVPATDTVAVVADTIVKAELPADSMAVTADPIAIIRRAVEHINTTHTVKKHFEFMCDEMTRLDYFYEGDELVKISVDFGTVGDVYAKEDYYYNNGELLFKYEFVEGGPACEGCIKTDEYRSYIQNGKVIKYLKNKTTATCRTCTFSVTSKENKLFKATTTDEIKGILCQ